MHLFCFPLPLLFICIYIYAFDVVLTCPLLVLLTFTHSFLIPSIPHRSAGFGLPCCLPHHHPHHYLFLFQLTCCWHAFACLRAHRKGEEGDRSGLCLAACCCCMEGRNGSDLGEGSDPSPYLPEYACHLPAAAAALPLPCLCLAL